MRIDCACGFACNHGTDHIADGQRLRAFCFGFTLGSNRVSGFAGLRYHKRNCLGRNDRIAITPFAGVVHLHRNACHALDHELTGLSCVPASSASGDIDLFRRPEFGRRDLHFVEKYVAGFLRNPTQRRVPHRARLLINFFEHEVLEAALFRHDRVPGDMLHLAHDGVTVEIAELDAVAGNDRQVAVSQKEKISRVIEDGGNV